MRKAIRSYTIHRLPACQDWKGNSYPKRYGVTLVTSGKPMLIDGGEYATREEAVAAGERALVNPILNQIRLNQDGERIPFGSRMA